jgi:single-strand DNA-binding protein
MNLNQVSLIGRLTKDPELRELQTGQKVTSFSMATNEFWTDKQGVKQEKTEFHNIVIWGRIAEVAAQYLQKGQECMIQGKMQTRSYQAKDGTTRYVTEVVGDFLQLGQRAQGSVKREPGQDAGRATPEEESAIDLDKEEIKIEDIPF